MDEEVEALQYDSALASRLPEPGLRPKRVLGRVIFFVREVSKCDISYVLYNKRQQCVCEI